MRCWPTWGWWLRACADTGILAWVDSKPSLAKVAVTAELRGALGHDTLAGAFWRQKRHPAATVATDNFTFVDNQRLVEDGAVVRGWLGDGSMDDALAQHCQYAQKRLRTHIGRP